MRKNTSHYIVLPVLLLCIAGCATTDRVPMPVPRTDDSIGWEVSVGDDLIVTTKEGQVYEFILLDIDQDYLVGENVNIATKDISNVQERVPRAEATVSLISGLSILVFFLVLPFLITPAAML